MNDEDCEVDSFLPDTFHWHDTRHHPSHSLHSGHSGAGVGASASAGGGNYVRSNYGLNHHDNEKERERERVYERDRDFLSASSSSRYRSGSMESIDIHTKRHRAGSISGRLRTASDLEECGLIDKNQKGVLKVCRE